MGNTNQLMERPKCPTCGTPMEYRLPKSKEQDFCGTWYECPNHGCACTILLPSKELRAQLAEQKKRLEEGGA